MHYTEKQWLEQFARVRAFWAHNGDKKRNHALLTSGKHSDGFFNGTKVTENPMILKLVAEDLVEKLQDAGLDLPGVHRVVGPAVGAITLAHELASAMRRKYFNPTAPRNRENPCNPLSGYTEKEGDTQALKRFGVFGESILISEDTMTTGGSVEKVALAINENAGRVLPFIAVICNRSGLHEIGGKKIISLIAPSIQSWDPDDCPICKADQGSKALRPKLSWAELTGEGGGE